MTVHTKYVHTSSPSTKVITPAWIIPVCGLCAAYYKTRVPIPLLLLQASLINDALFWAGHTGASAEIVSSLRVLISNK